MLLRLTIIALICMFISISSVSLFAGHPLITDDATIADDKRVNLSPGPACNFTGNLELLELTVGGAWTHEAHRTRNSGVAIQGKSIFKPLETNGWGLGLAAGTLWHPEGDSNHRAYILLLVCRRAFRSKTTESLLTVISVGIS